MSTTVPLEETKDLKLANRTPDSSKSNPINDGKARITLSTIVPVL
jgi:hypothetical protein